MSVLGLNTYVDSCKIFRVRTSSEGSLSKFQGRIRDYESNECMNDAWRPHGLLLSREKAWAGICKWVRVHSALARHYSLKWLLIPSRNIQSSPPPLSMLCDLIMLNIPEQFYCWTHSYQLIEWSWNLKHYFCRLSKSYLLLGVLWLVFKWDIHSGSRGALQGKSSSSWGLKRAEILLCDWSLLMKWLAWLSL